MLNAKINYITEKKIDGVEYKQQEITEYSKIVASLTEHNKLRASLKSKWDRMIIEPEFSILEEAGEFKIRSNSDRVVIVTLDNEDLANNILTLMNLAFRDGAKQIIKVLEIL
jgi:hypothetical protein